MKQPKLPKVPPPPTVPLVPQGPRYRYFLTPPTTVIVQAGDLAAAIPEGFRAGVFDRERPIEVPCDAFLGGVAPGISLSVLNALIPECFTQSDFSEARVTLPVQRIALAYHLIPGKEVLPEPEPEFVPLEELVPENSEAAKEPAVEPEPELVREPMAEANPEAPVDHAAEWAEKPVPAAPEAPPEESSAPEPVLPRTRRPFSILPSFRRRQPEEAPQENPQENPELASRARVQIPKPRAPQGPLVPPPPEVSADEVAPAEAVRPEPPAIPVPPAEFAPIVAEAEGEARSAPQEEIPPPVVPPEPEPAPEAMWIDSEHEATPAARALAQIPHQDGLQAVFMTEEVLGVEEVIQRCGALPGVRSCVLSRGSAVMAAHNVPDRVDLVSLSAHAFEMLASMRTSVAKMGIGAVPAVTVHSDAGPITFFNQDDLCLLIFHKDRGFVPGVREKLQQVVEELSRANLPLLLSSSSPETPAA